MNRQYFLTTVRSFAALHRRLGRDFSAQVRAIADGYVTRVMQDNPDQDVATLRADVERVVTHEYGELTPATPPQSQG